MRDKARHSKRTWWPAPNVARVEDSGRARKTAATALAAAVRYAFTSPASTTELVLTFATGLIDEEYGGIMVSLPFGDIIWPVGSHLEAKEGRSSSRLHCGHILLAGSMGNYSGKYGR